MDISADLTCGHIIMIIVMIVCLVICCCMIIVSLFFQSGLTAYDVAKVSGHQSVCDELQRHSNKNTKTEITKVRVYLRCLQLRPLISASIIAIACSLCPMCSE